MQAPESLADDTPNASSYCEDGESALDGNLSIDLSDHLLDSSDIDEEALEILSQRNRAEAFSIQNEMQSSLLRRNPNDFVVYRDSPRLPAPEFPVPFVGPEVWSGDEGLEEDSYEFYGDDTIDELPSVEVPDEPSDGILDGVIDERVHMMNILDYNKYDDYDYWKRQAIELGDNFDRDSEIPPSILVFADGLVRNKGAQTAWGKRHNRAHMARLVALDRLEVVAILDVLERKPLGGMHGLVYHNKAVIHDEHFSSRRRINIDRLISTMFLQARIYVHAGVIKPRAAHESSDQLIDSSFASIPYSRLAHVVTTSVHLWVKQHTKENTKAPVPVYINPALPGRVGSPMIREYPTLQWSEIPDDVKSVMTRMGFVTHAELDGTAMFIKINYNTFLDMSRERFSTTANGLSFFHMLHFLSYDSVTPQSMTSAMRAACAMQALTNILGKMNVVDLSWGGAIGMNFMAHHDEKDKEAAFFLNEMWTPVSQALASCLSIITDPHLLTQYRDLKNAIEKKKKKNRARDASKKEDAEMSLRFAVAFLKAKKQEEQNIYTCSIKKTAVGKVSPVEITISRKKEEYGVFISNSMIRTPEIQPISQAPSHLKKAADASANLIAAVVGKNLGHEPVLAIVRSLARFDGETVEPDAQGVLYYETWIQLFFAFFLSKRIDKKGGVGMKSEFLDLMHESITFDHMDVSGVRNLLFTVYANEHPQFWDNIKTLRWLEATGEEEIRSIAALSRTEKKLPHRVQLRIF